MSLLLTDRNLSIRVAGVLKGVASSAWVGLYPGHNLLDHSISTLETLHGVKHIPLNEDIPNSIRWSPEETTLRLTPGMPPDRL